MFAALLLLQSSLLVAPLELGDKPPETRAIAAVRFTLDDADQRAIVDNWRAKATAGSSEFVAFARSCAEKPNGDVSGVLGTYWKSMVAQEAGDFLFSAAVGEVSQLRPPADHAAHPNALVAVRLERDAACRQIFVAGTDDRARSAADGMLRALRAGADFAQLAREKSDDRASALRGGDFAIFERGRNDALLRQAAFDLKVGEISGVIASPLGFHILQRVEVSALDPRLRDDVWARARGIVIAFDGAKGADPTLKRDHDQAERIADDLAARIRRGEDMGALAKEFNDDGRGEHGGRARAGDLGWVRRATTAMPQFMDRLFTDVPGTLIGPIATEAGYVLVRREDPGPRSRIELKSSAFVNLHCSVLARMDDVYDTERDPAEQRAIAAARALRTLFGPTEDPQLLRTWVQRCSSAADLIACAERLPEVAHLSSGADIALRMLALDYARALAGIEQQFMTGAWPPCERKLSAELAQVRERFALLGDSALDGMMTDLAISDPRIIVKVYLVAFGTPGQIDVIASSMGGPCVICVKDIDANVVPQLVIHAATEALDLANRDQPSVLNQVRQRTLSALAKPDLSPVVFLAAGAVVRRVFDPSYSEAGMVFGATAPALHGYTGQYARTYNWPWSEPLIHAWTDYLAGKKTRAEALDAIVAAAKASK